MKDKLLEKLIVKQKEISSPPTPNELGRFTPLYRKIIIYFKISPYKLLIPLAFILTIVIYLIFKNQVVNLVTILQHGF